tara:strand:- start:1379 stop:3085 length:1707 start_codon:yes stop_codon:yes gene_type:complete
MLASLVASGLALRAPAVHAPRRSGARSRIRACAIAEAEEELGGASAAVPEQWVALAMRERYPILRDISSSILTRRTLEEAELALKVEEDFRADPSLFADIDFEQLVNRIEADRSPESCERLQSVMTVEEFANVSARWDQVVGELEALLPTYSSDQRNITSGVAAAVPKIKRVIEKAREIPLTVDLPREMAMEDVDVGAVMQESKNVATGLRNVWSRINGRGVREEDLQELQKEAKALLQLRAEATKLRASIRLVQRQKELKASFLIKTNDNDFLEQTLMADVSIARLEKELSLKVAFLEMERIFITLESELRASSTLVDQLLSVVERYGSMEASLRSMVVEAAEGRHSAIDMEELAMLEADVGDILLQLGLQMPEQEKISWARTRDNLVLTFKKTQQGLVFYGRGVQLIGQDLQLAANMLVRAVLQGYTLRSREVRLLRRILKDLVTLVPFVVILIIPLSPLGHVLVFSFIQRFFPDFFPSAFTESRQQLMSMYSSITTPAAEATLAQPAAAAAAAAVAAAKGALSDEVDGSEVDGTIAVVQPGDSSEERGGTPSSSLFSPSEPDDGE